MVETWMVVAAAAERMVMVMVAESMVVVVAVMFSSATTPFEFVHAIGWRDPQCIHVIFVVILNQTFGFEVMPFG